MDYLAIINRTDFTNLYKFGHLFIHNLVPFDGNIQEHAEDKHLFETVSSKMDTYEYASEYLLVHISRPIFCGSAEDIYVNDLVALYALNQEAKDNLSLSLDPRIKIEVSNWSAMFDELNKKQAVRQAKSGMYNCFEIFQITEEERNFVKSILPKDFIEELFDDLFKRVRPVGEKNLWNYVTRYERHQAYWNDKRGYFLDAIHAFENYKQQHEVEYEIADETHEGDVIASCGDSFTEILQNLHRINTSYKIDNCNFFVVGPLYFYLKGYFKEGGITPANFFAQETLFNSLHRSYGENFALAIALLGISLGQDLTYSCYYQVKNIGIFHNENQSVKQPIDSDNAIINPETKLPIECNEAQSLIDGLYNEVLSLRNRVGQLSREIANLENDNEVEDHGRLDSEPLDIESDKKKESTAEDIITSEAQEISSSTGTIPVQTNDIFSKAVLDGTKNQNEISDFEPVVMRKLNRNRRSFDGRNKNPIVAHTQQEYDELIANGYAPENFFDSNSLLNQMVD